MFISSKLRIREVHKSFGNLKIKERIYKVKTLIFYIGFNYPPSFQIKK